MPSERKEPFGLHFLHDGFPFEVLIAGVGNLAARDLTRYERTLQFHAKPLVELAVVRQGTPDSRTWRLKFNAFNAVSILRNLQVAEWHGLSEKQTF